MSHQRFSVSRKLKEVFVGPPDSPDPVQEHFPAYLALLLHLISRNACYLLILLPSFMQ